MSVTTEDRRDVAAIHPVRFWVAYSPVTRIDRGKAVDTGEVKGSDWVEWVKKGDAQRSTTSEKVDRVMRDPILWEAIRPHYEGWKKGQDAVLVGTPLDAVPFIEREVGKVLASVHIRTVEDLAGAEDSALAKLNIPGIRSMRNKAQAFLDAQRTVSGVSGELAALREMVERLTAEKEEAERSRDAMASETGRRRRSREEVMQGSAEG